MGNKTRMTYRIILCVFFCVSALTLRAQDITKPTKTEAQEKLEEKARQAEELRKKQQAAAEADREAIEEIKAAVDEEIAKLNLPEDASPLMTVKEIQINGNTLVPTEQLLENVPPVYNSSDKPIDEAESEYLFDFRIIQDIIAQPGRPYKISARTVQGFTRYILSVYQKKNYAGIYVYIPINALGKDRQLKGEILPVNVLEATVSQVTVTHYNTENEIVEDGYLRDSAVEEWSPMEVGDVANQKELNEFVNLLNINPDRYVSAIISKGTEPNSIALGYNIYEANPWHWFIQVDNSGTKDRQWTPRIGLINTNLLGIDDTFTAIYQAPWESDIDENYSLYGSYDFPILGPRLRLNLFAGYSQFDINPDTGNIDFLGNGNFYGGTLRFNVFQKDKWFFDVTGTLSHERSKITPSLFPEFLGTDIKMDLWGWGIDIHHRDDMSETSLTFNRLDSFGGSDNTEFGLARTGANRNFSIYTTAASHTQYLDPNEVQRVSATFKWITSDERLIPSKMTTFGGMYSVRGYDEYEIIADGGILTSIQYEFDLVAYDEAMDVYQNDSGQQEEKPFLRKLAPLAFLDYGLAKVEDPRTTEHKDQELCSVGGGVSLELGDNFSGTVYYGYPLIATDATRTGKGRLSAGFMFRW